ncbi:MAG: hypothetical protein LBD27_07855 [Tannerella sp.]|nr:hypothetical protein [Tannerella sp.]
MAGGVNVDGHPFGLPRSIEGVRPLEPASRKGCKGVVWDAFLPSDISCRDAGRHRQTMYVFVGPVDAIIDAVDTVGAHPCVRPANDAHAPSTP